jgi:hypothetical protein
MTRNQDSAEEIYIQIFWKALDVHVCITSMFACFCFLLLHETNMEAWRKRGYMKKQREYDGARKINIQDRQVREERHQF